MTPTITSQSRALPSAEPAAASGPRLAPIDRYAGFWLAILRTGFRMMFGKVMMPMRVVFPRIPGYAFPHLCLMWFVQRGLSLPRTLTHVLSMRVSRNNRCGFCFDMHKASFMLLEKPSAATLELASAELTDPTLDPKLRALLAYADDVVQQGDVRDETFAALTRSFSEKQVVEIVWLAAFVVFTNMLSRPLRLSSDDFCAIVAKRAPSA